MGKTKPPPKVVTWTGNAFDVNLRAMFNAWYPGGMVPGDTILSDHQSRRLHWRVIDRSLGIAAGRLAGDCQPAATLTLMIQGRIQGAGGQGGGTNSNGGLGGGGAIYMDRGMNMVTNGAQIFGGGGGGGNSQLIQGGTQFNGGGGCGYNPGPAGGPGPPGDGWWIMGQDGTTENGGTGFRTVLDPNCKIGDGGGPGQPGTTAYSNAPGYYYDFAGGPAGWAVYGWGNCSFGNWDGTKKEFVYTGAHNADIRGGLA